MPSSASALKEVRVTGCGVCSPDSVSIGEPSDPERVLEGGGASDGVSGDSLGRMRAPWLGGGVWGRLRMSTGSGVDGGSPTGTLDRAPSLPPIRARKTLLERPESVEERPEFFGAIRVPDLELCSLLLLLLLKITTRLRYYRRW